MVSDLKKLLDNFDADQIEVMETIAMRLAGMKIESYTGELIFSINSNQGCTGDIHVTRREIVRLKKRGRGVRSGGV